MRLDESRFSKCCPSQKPQLPGLVSRAQTCCARILGGTQGSRCSDAPGATDPGAGARRPLQPGSWPESSAPRSHPQPCSVAPSGARCIHTLCWLCGVDLSLPSCSGSLFKASQRGGVGTEREPVQGPRGLTSPLAVYVAPVLSLRPGPTREPPAPGVRPHTGEPLPSPGKGLQFVEGKDKTNGQGRGALG